MDEWLDIVANVGFPIAISAYLLVRIEDKMGKLATAITELRETIITLPGQFNRENSRTTCPLADHTQTGQNNFSQVSKPV
ncbi:MAG: YvrJ family protein [Syntrophomonas sp.]